MSDTDEEGEGTFDKEEEREKLREQLEREEENRRSTQHMSELLLKGATMTNKHCDTCGDPLFRYEGQEFCPTCSQQGAAEGGETAAEPDSGGSEGADAAGQSADAAGARTDVPGDGPPAQRSREIDRVDTGAAVGGAEGPTIDVGRATASSAEPSSSGHQRQAGDADGRQTGGDVEGDVADARAALARKLSSLARQAEATEDVGRSRELLAAAREAAEAIAAISAIDR